LCETFNEIDWYRRIYDKNDRTFHKWWNGRRQQ
jgi:hypothetical protein